MTIYYVPNKQTELYNMSDFEAGTKKISEIQSEISARSDFCREEESIFRKELAGYLGSGITIYVVNEESALLGVLNFNVNRSVDDVVKYIVISGICTPPPSSGSGTKLITAIKDFARSNYISQIKLSCYDEKVMKFYEQNEFRVVGSSTVEDSDEDSDDEDEKVKYDMLYIIESGGRKKRKTTRKRKSIRKRKSVRKRKSIRKRKSVRN
jgi:hypothetical protein